MAYIYDLSDAWSASGTTFTGIKLNVTDTASAAGSLLMDLQVGGVSRFRVGKTGSIFSAAGGILAIADSTATDILQGRWGPSFPVLRAFITGGIPSFDVAASGFFRFSNDALSVSTFDVILARDAANTLAQRNGVAAQAFNLYGTYTDASNYRRLSSTISTGGVAEIKSEGLGSGISGNTLKFIVGSTTAISIATNGDTTLNGLNMNTGGISNAFNIRTLDTGYHGFTTQDVGFARSAAGVAVISNASTGGASLEFREQTAPAAPAANNVRIYAEDDGAGKTRIMARFATGAAVQIAIEP